MQSEYVAVCGESGVCLTCVKHGHLFVWGDVPSRGLCERATGPVEMQLTTTRSHCKYNKQESLMNYECFSFERLCFFLLKVIFEVSGMGCVYFFRMAALVNDIRSPRKFGIAQARAVLSQDL